MRFALWGAEEANLVGSTFYVGGLSEEEHAKIALYLNFDMVGSPNHGFFIYDGDDSDATGAGPGPAGSAQIEKTFERFFESRKHPVQGHRLHRTLRLRAIHRNRYPVGRPVHGRRRDQDGRGSGALGWQAGVAYDPCYHQACDTFANNNNAALAMNADATAYATLQYAMSTSDVNGAKGKGNFKPPTTEDITGLSAK